MAEQKLPKLSTTAEIRRAKSKTSRVSAGPDQLLTIREQNTPGLTGFVYFIRAGAVRFVRVSTDWRGIRGANASP